MMLNDRDLTKMMQRVVLSLTHISRRVVNRLLIYGQTIIM